MRITGIGHLLFAAGLAGLGVLSLFSGDFAFVWQPVPAGVPWREALARASGVILLAGGFGMLLRRPGAAFALAMAAYLLSWVVLLQSPRVAHAPANIGAWLGFCENLVLVCGGWTLFASLAGPQAGLLAGSGARRTARLLLGASCLVLGLSHFAYTGGTASMIPAWIPFHTGFAYLTGAGHLAAGAGILLSVVPRLAATLEALMISTFVALIHIPGVLGAPGRLQWTMLFVASALAGAVWIVAKSLEGLPWGPAPRAPAAQGPREAS